MAELQPFPEVGHEEEEELNFDKLERDKLRAEGRSQGIAEGMAQGEAKVLDGMRARAAGRARDRFGDRAATETAARLAGVKRLARLMEAYEWVVDCETESTLLARLATI